MRRKLLAGLLAVCCLTTSGCWLLDKFIKRSVAINPVLEPLEVAETPQLIAEINRLAAFRSMSGKVDLEFEDLSAAGAGIAEKYKRADGKVYVQRPGQIYLTIEGPLSTKIAEMASDGTSFRVAVYQGDPTRRRFVKGTNANDYSKLRIDDLKDEKKTDKAMQTEKQRVGVFTKIRPQHFIEGLLLNTVKPTPANGHIYVKSETTEDGDDPRPNAKKSVKAVHSYYLLDEVTTNGDGMGRVTRRFWFDRYQTIQLARVQIFGDNGAVTTDVAYSSYNPVGSAGFALPTRLSIRRPQEKYGLIITYQDPAQIVLGKEFDLAVFVLDNKQNLPELDLDDLLRRKGTEED